jgi:hypothetical protein
LSAKELLWEKTYGGTGDDRAFAMAAADNGFLIAGSSTSFTSGKTAGLVVRTDSNGNMLWNRTYQERAGSEFRNVQRMAEGFLLVGNTFSSSVDEDAWIVRIDDQGSVIWNRTIGGLGINKIFSAATTPDGFVLVGLTYSSSNADSDGWIIKTDINGNLLWNKTVGGYGNDAFRSVYMNENHSYAIAGYTDSNGSGNYDFWLVKISENGTILWSRNYGGGESDKAYALTGATDGYIIAGDTHPTGKTDVDALVMKTDLNGRLVWEKAYGGDDFDEANTIIATKNGEYVVAGFTFSFGKGQRDFWIFKIDDSGNIVWSRVHGREAFEEAYAIVEVKDNDYVVSGWTNSIGAGSYDYYFIRTKIVPLDISGVPRALGFYVLTFLGLTAIILFSCLYFRLNRRKIRQDAKKAPTT